MVLLHAFVAGILSLAFALFLILRLFQRRRQPQPPSLASKSHPVISYLDEFTTAFGTQWPPNTSDYTSWSRDLQAYHHIWVACQPNLATAVASLNHIENRIKIDQFRQSISEKLDAANLTPCKIKAALAQEMTLESWNGFAACIAFLRHAYRWGLIPVVAPAQEEMDIVLPRALDIPWLVLQNRYGCTSASGSMNTNVYFNVDITQGKLLYLTTASLSPVHIRTEWAGSILFYEIERKAAPLYSDMGFAIQSLEDGNPMECQRRLEAILATTKAIFKYAFDSMKDANISHALLLPYWQGFHCWSAGEPREDGVTGAQTFFMHVLDSFLSIKPYDPEPTELFIPLVQRRFLTALREYDIRMVASQRKLTKIESILEDMVRQLKIWRLGHLKRMVPYESVKLPERLKMTAGLSVLEKDGTSSEIDFVEHLKKHLHKRVMETK